MDEFIDDDYVSVHMFETKYNDDSPIVFYREVLGNP